MGPVPSIVVLLASGEAAVNTTESPWLKATGVVSERFLTSALVELNEQTEMPEASVGEQAGRVLTVPEIEKSGVSPGIGLKKPSKIVTDTFAVDPAVTVGVVTKMLDSNADGAPGRNVIVPPFITFGEVN
jgi:hypothetical protein